MRTVSRHRAVDHRVLWRGGSVFDGLKRRDADLIELAEGISREGEVVRFVGRRLFGAYVHPHYVGVGELATTVAAPAPLNEGGPRRQFGDQGVGG